MISVTEKNGGVLISGAENFSVMQTFDCGQCFRFDLTENGAVGYAFGKRIALTQISDSEVFISPCTADEFDRVFKS